WFCIICIIKIDNVTLKITSFLLLQKILIQMSQFHKLKVKEVKQITPKAVTILFEIPDSLKSEYQFSAGQYITIKKEINGQELRRDYSICSSPKSNEIKVGVKKVEGGIFSVF